MEDHTQPTGQSLSHSEREILFEGIYNITFDAIYTTLLRVFKREGLVRDALQEAYLRLWIRLGEGHRQDDYMPFLYFHGRNYLVKQIVRDLKRELLENGYSSGKEQVNAEQQIEVKEYETKLSIAINKLPEKRKKVYKLFYEEGLSYRSIAEQLSISRKTVDNHLSQATIAIKKELKSIYWVLIALLFNF